MLLELAEQFDLYANQIAPWKSQLLDGVVAAFGGEAKVEPAAVSVDLKTLHAKIGSLTLENEFRGCALQGGTTQRIVCRSDCR